MPAGITEQDTMFSVRERPWHGLGTIVQEPVTDIEQALHLAGLDWSVERRTLTVEGLGETEDYYATVRSDTNTVLGVVGAKYEVVQNVAALRFLDHILGELRFETAGGLWGGKKIWALVRTPDHIEVGGDPVEMFTLVTTAHDGSGALRVAVTPIRVVCQNTLTWALASAARTFSTRHVGDVTARVFEARKTLDLTVNYAKQFKALGDRLASSAFTERKLAKVFDELWPTEGLSPRVRQNRMDAREVVQMLFVGTTAGNAPKSGWAAANAFAEYADWYTATRGKNAADNRFNAQMEDVRGLKSKALKLVLAA